MKGTARVAVVTMRSAPAAVGTVGLVVGTVRLAAGMACRGTPGLMGAARR